MRVGYIQFSPVFGKKDLNLRKVEQFLEGAKADLIVLPELFATGYLFESRQELLNLAETPDGETFGFLRQLSKDRAVAMVGGIAERDADSCYNSCFLFSEGDVRASYRKIHLFDREKEIFTPGDLGYAVSDLKRVKIGLMICFDWIFPEATRVLALKGAQIICHPSNLVLSHCPPAMITRCIENGVFAITGNRVGREARAGIELEFIGTSQVVSPKGEVLVRAGGDEVIQIIEIDPSQADNKMVTPRNHVLADRRPQFYAPLL